MGDSAAMQVRTETRTMKNKATRTGTKTKFCTPVVPAKVHRTLQPRRLRQRAKTTECCQRVGMQKLCGCCPTQSSGISKQQKRVRSQLNIQAVPRDLD